MRKKKPLPFKKGMAVIWLTEDYGRITLTEGEVTVVTTRDGAQLIHTRAPDSWGGFWKRSFSPVAGMFQENPYPIWKLMPLNGQNVKNMRKRAERATKLFQKNREAYSEIQRQVESEARTWQCSEIERRATTLPNGPKFLKSVVARLGFKHPKNGIKVKVNSSITTVK